MSTWQNADGIRQTFGTYHSDPANRFNRARGLNTLGAFNQIEMDVDLSLLTDATASYPADLDNDGTNDGFTVHDAYLPAYSAITRCIFVSSETAAGGTDVDIGLFQADGTAIDADGLFVDLLVAEAAVGEVSHGDGALVAESGIGGASIGANDGYIALTPNGTFTAGKGRLIIEYITPIADA